MKEILQAISDAYDNHQDLVMATIIENVGSSPRAAGTKMLVRRDQSIVGTVGGGRLEANAIQASGAVFENQKSILYHFELTGEDAAKMDMICGGFGDILLTFISSKDEVTKEVFQAALQASNRNEQGWLVTGFKKDGSIQSNYCFIDQFGEKYGDLVIDGQSLAEMKGTPGEISIHSDLLLNSEVLIERIQRRKKLIIFGGGHVARETTRLAEEVDFETVVIDDRIEFANPERFPNAQTIVIEEYSKLPDLGIDAESFVVIVTRGHLGDYDVLKEILKTDAFYVGMIGSRHKRELIYKRLLNEGTTQQQIDRVHSPIGLPINGQTPMEIAVSIVAELILERSRLK